MKGLPDKVRVGTCWGVGGWGWFKRDNLGLGWWHRESRMRNHMGTKQKVLDRVMEGEDI